MLTELKEFITDTWNIALKEIRGCDTFWQAMFCFMYHLLGISSLTIIGLFAVISIIGVFILAVTYLPIALAAVAFIVIGTWLIRKKSNG